MSILGWILFGFIVGLIARVLMPGRDPLGLIGTIVLGIVGALAAGWVGYGLGFYKPDEGPGFVAATIGAVIVLAIYYGVIGHKRGVRGSRTQSAPPAPPAQSEERPRKSA